MADPVVNPQGGDGQQAGGGATPPAWTAQLKEDLKGQEFFTKFESVTDLGKFAMDADGKLQKAIIPPGEGASKEEVDAYYQKLGRPASADEYVIPEDVPPELMSDAGKTWFKQQMFDLGLSKDKAAALVKSYAAVQVAAWEEFKKNSLQSLRNEAEWNTDDKFAANMGEVARAVKWLDMPEFNALMDSSGLGNAAPFVKAFRKIGMALAEGSFVKGAGGGGGKEDDKGLRYPSMEENK